MPCPILFELLASFGHPLFYPSSFLDRKVNKPDNCVGRTVNFGGSGWIVVVSSCSDRPRVHTVHGSSLMLTFE